MADKELPTTGNVAGGLPPRKEWPSIGTRCTPDELRDLEALAYRKGKKKADLILEAVRRYLADQRKAA